MPAPLPPAGRKRIMARRNEAQSIFQHDRDHGLWLASGFRLSPLWSVISVFHLRDLCDRGVKLPQDSGLIPPVPCPWSMVSLLDHYPATTSSQCVQCTLVVLLNFS